MLNSSHAQTQASSSGWWFVWQKCPFCLCVSSHLNVIGLFVHERPLFSFMTSVHLHAPNTGLLWCLNVWLNGSQMSPKVLLILKGLLRSIRNWSSGSIWRKKLRCCSSGVGYRQGIRFLNVYFESLIKATCVERWQQRPHSVVMCVASGHEEQPWTAAACHHHLCKCVMSKDVPPWVCRGLNDPLWF